MIGMIDGCAIRKRCKITHTVNERGEIWKEKLYDGYATMEENIIITYNNTFSIFMEDEKSKKNPFSYGRKLWKF